MIFHCRIILMVSKTCGHCQQTIKSYQYQYTNALYRYMLPFYGRHLINIVLCVMLSILLDFYITSNYLASIGCILDAVEWLPVHLTA